MFLNRIQKKTIRYFISLGAGINQLPLIMEAKSLGFQVIGVDNNSSAPGFIKCDLKIQESIENYKEIYTKLLELLIDGKIYGILSRSYGSAIKTTAFLCDKFNIPYLPDDICDVFINKKYMKELIIQSDIETPNMINVFAKTKQGKINDNIFPLIAKPVTGHAKTDVRLLKNAGDFNKHTASVKKNNDHYMYESFVKGNEIIAAGIVHEKKFYLIDITDKETTFPPYFVDKIHISPSRYYHLFETIESIGQRVSDAYQIKTSPIIMEFIVDESEKLHLIEAVPEFGGEFLADIVIPNRTGYNVFSEAIKSMTGTDFKIPIKKKNKEAVVCRYIMGDKGILSSFNSHGPKKIKGVLFSRIFKEIGAEIKKPVTNHDRIGVVITKGKTIEDASRAAEEAELSFNIRIKQN